MSYQGPRKPIIIPIPLNHFTTNGIDTTTNTAPTILQLQFNDAGWQYFRRTIYPYIWQGYQVKIRTCPTRQITGNPAEIFKTNVYDFSIRGQSGESGAFGLYITVPATNTITNNLIRWRDALYTENGVAYSYYSYVIYP